MSPPPPFPDALPAEFALGAWTVRAAGGCWRMCFVRFFQESLSGGAWRATFDSTYTRR